MQCVPGTQLCELSPMPGQALVQQILEAPFTHTLVDNPNKTWFNKLDFGCICTLFCHGCVLHHPRKSSVTQHNSPEQGHDRIKEELGRLRIARHATQLRSLGLGRHPRRKFQSYPFLFGVCLCDIMAAAWFSLWVLRQAARAESSGLGVSEEGGPGQQASSIWYRVA